MDENLGRYATDEVTNFGGIVTAKCEYLDGSCKYLVTPSVDTNGNMRDEKWIDSKRLIFGEIMINKRNY